MKVDDEQWLSGSTKDKKALYLATFQMRLYNSFRFNLNMGFLNKVLYGCFEMNYSFDYPLCLCLGVPCGSRASSAEEVGSHQWGTPWGSARQHHTSGSSRRSKRASQDSHRSVHTKTHIFFHLIWIWVLPWLSSQMETVSFRRHLK